MEKGTLFVISALWYRIFTETCSEVESFFIPPATRIHDVRGQSFDFFTKPILWG